MANKKDIHSVFQQNKLSYDLKQGVYREDFIQASFNAFIELGFFDIIPYKAYQLYIAIYSEVDKETNKVQRPMNYWGKKIERVKPTSEDENKRLEKKWSNQLTILRKAGLVTVKYGAPKTEAHSNKIIEREYNTYSINTFEYALRTQIKNGLRPAEDIELIGRSGNKTTLPPYEATIEAEEEAVTIEEEVTPTEEVKEDIKKEEEEMKNYKNQPTQIEMETYYRGKEEKLRESKMNNVKKSANLINLEATYYHPILNGISSAPIVAVDEKTGDFYYVNDESEDKRLEFLSPEDVVNHFYKEFEIPSSKMAMKRDVPALRNLWRDVFGPQAKVAGVEALDLIMFTISSAKILSYDTDKKVDDLFKLQYYMDEGMGNLQDKKNALAAENEARPSEAKPIVSNINEEEEQQAIQEYSFLDSKNRQKIIDIIRIFGYKPGFSNNVKELIKIYNSLGREFEVTDSIKDEYYHSHINS